MGIKQEQYYSWSNTNGTGDSIRKIFNLDPKVLEEVSGFTSFVEVINYCTTGDKRGKSRLFNRMNEYRKGLQKEFGQNIDPVRYLIFLYFQEGKSIIDIFNSENNKGLNYKDSTGLGKVFKDTFAWILRDNSGSQLTTKRKKANGQINKAHTIINESYKKRHEKVITYIKDKINIILGPFPKFSLEKFDKLKKQDQILYILSCLNGINRNDIIKIYENKSGDRIIAEELNKIIIDFIKSNEINNFIIYPKDIKNIRKS